MTDPTLSLEENVLGAMMLDGSQVDIVDLGPGDFLSANHRRIYQAIRSLRDRNAVIDAVTSTLLPAVQNAELKALVVKVAPAFEAHMIAAQNLEKKLAGR